MNIKQPSKIQNPVVLFDSHQNDWQTHFWELRSHHDHPYSFIVDKDGRLTYTRGDGDFGILVCRHPVRKLELLIKIAVPQGSYHFTNSGIFFGFGDLTQNPDSLTPAPHWPADWNSILKTRTPAYLAAWQGYEVQLLAGTEQNNVAPQHKNGAIYDIPLGTEQGKQQARLFSFRHDLTSRDELVYEIRLSWAASKTHVWMREETEKTFTHVTQFLMNDPTRAHVPAYWGLQSYFNDGNQCRAFRFISILTENN